MIDLETHLEIEERIGKGEIPLIRVEDALKLSSIERYEQVMLREKLIETMISSTLYEDIIRKQISQIEKGQSNE